MSDDGDDRGTLHVVRGTPVGKHRRSYTKREKAEVVGMVAVMGQMQTAEESGLPLSTVNRWWNEPTLREYREAKQGDIADAIRVGVLLGLHRMAGLIPTETDLGKVNAATGTLFDKLQLIEGRATSRSETMTDGMDDHERADLRAVLRDAVHAGD